MTQRALITCLEQSFVSASLAAVVEGYVPDILREAGPNVSYHALDTIWTSHQTYFNHFVDRDCMFEKSLSRTG